MGANTRLLILHTRKLLDTMEEGFVTADGLEDLWYCLKKIHACTGSTELELVIYMLGSLLLCDEVVESFEASMLGRIQAVVQKIKA